MRDADSIKEVSSPFKLRENIIARYWGLKPWEFRNLLVERKAELFATYMAEKEIESYYNKELLKKSKPKKSGIPGYSK